MWATNYLSSEYSNPLRDLIAIRLTMTSGFLFWTTDLDLYHGFDIARENPKTIYDDMTPVRLEDQLVDPIHENQSPYYTN